MKFIYIIGAYTASTTEEVEQNVHKVAKIAGEIINISDEYFLPLVPHFQGWWLETYTHTNYTMQSAEYWYKHTLEILKRCDSALIVGDIGFSEGSMAEVKWCIENYVPFTQTDGGDLKMALGYLKGKLGGRDD
jgi:hypothetical protein